MELVKCKIPSGLLIMATAVISMISPLKADVTGNTSTLNASYVTQDQGSAFFQSYFFSKTKRDVEATVAHFDETDLVYIDVPLGWSFHGRQAMRQVFSQYMPNWPDSASSYPLRVLGNETSALVAFVNTPELFGSEIRAFAAVDTRDGKVIRWVDYWDGKHFGRERTNSLRNSSTNQISDYKDAIAGTATKTRIFDVSHRLHDALGHFAENDLGQLFTDDAVYEDLTLHVLFQGKNAILNYLDRAKKKHPFGSDAELAHVVGDSQSGGYEWIAASAFKTTVRRGITALELDETGRITRLTTLWDGSAISDAQLSELLLLGLD